MYKPIVKAKLGDEMTIDFGFPPLVRCRISFDEIKPRVKRNSVVTVAQLLTTTAPVPIVSAMFFLGG